MSETMISDNVRDKEGDCGDKRSEMGEQGLCTEEEKSVEIN